MPERVNHWGRTTNKDPVQPKSQSFNEALQVGLGTKEGLSSINDGKKRQMTGLHRLSVRLAKAAGRKPGRRTFVKGEAGRVIQVERTRRYAESQDGQNGTSLPGDTQSAADDAVRRLRGDSSRGRTDQQVDRDVPPVQDAAPRQNQRGARGR
jgi:hypothetical protein